MLFPKQIKPPSPPFLIQYYGNRLALASPFYLSAQPETFPPRTDPYGLSYGEWSAEWWKWLHSSPEDRNPATDTTGAFCAENQNASGRIIQSVTALTTNAETTAETKPRTKPITTERYGSDSTNIE